MDKLTTKQLIEELNKLCVPVSEEADMMEDTFIDEFEAELTPSFNDEASLVDQLDAKTKIARAVEVLKKAVEDFKDSTVGEVDLLDDASLISSIESLDDVVKLLEDGLKLGTGEIQPNEPEMEENEMENDFQDEEVIEDNDDIEENAEDEELEEIDFDDEAALDFLNNEDNGDDEGDF